MVLNTLGDLAAGLVPFAGDVADIAWKSNTLNLALLERHERPGVRPSSGDWAVVLLAMAVIGGALALVLLSVANDALHGASALPVNVADFSFDLPAELVAQFPPDERGSSRLLVLDRRTGAVTHSDDSGASPGSWRPAT